MGQIEERILVVDDDDVARMAICDILEGSGYRTFELPSAIGVSNTIRKEKIHAVVLDVNMPTVAGNKVAKMLRENSLFDDVATLLISERDFRELSELGEAARADAVVMKAHMRTELVRTVKRAIRTIRSTTAARRP